MQMHKIWQALLLTASISRADFAYDSFGSSSGLQLNGHAAVTSNVLRLTPSEFGRAGSAFTSVPIQLGNLSSFSVLFVFRITGPNGIGDADGIGADGLVFVLQTVSNSVGSGGGGIGFQGISPSVGVEFDTYYNGGWDDLLGGSGNHVGLNLNGDPASVQMALEPTRFNNGNLWHAWIDYSGATKTIEVRWSLTGVRPLLPMLSRSVDLQAQLGQSSAFIGFTSATGAGYGAHEIHQWYFRSSYNPVGDAPLQKPVLNIEHLPTEQAVSLKFETVLGQEYKIQQSLDLVTWSDVKMGIQGDGSIQTHAFSRGDSHRFYRVVTYRPVP
jgi:hypothetical protein